MRIFIYLFPALVNYILGGTFFIAAYEFSVAGHGSFVVTCVIAAWALIYSLTSAAMSKITTEKNAARLIVAAGFGISVSSLIFIILPSIGGQFIGIAAIGVTSAVYCAPFQIFMKQLEPDQQSGVVRSTALYTGSWSIGMATGPFIFGLLDRNTGFIINVLMGLFMAGSIWWIDIKHRRNSGHKHQASSVPSAKNDDSKYPAPVAPRVQAVNYAKMPDYAWVGWLVAGVGTVAVALVRTLVPYRANLLHMSKGDAGIILAVVSYAQATMGFLLIRSRYWMYKPGPPLLIGAAGTLAVLFFAFSNTITPFFIGAVLYGAYSGCIYFYLVFHSLAHPSKSVRYVAINEITVGFASVTGALAGGAVSQVFNASTSFMLCAIAILAVAVFQWRVFWLGKINKT